MSGNVGIGPSNPTTGTAGWVVSSLLVMVVSPDLMKERAHPKADAKAWDRVSAHLTGPFGSTVMLIVAGLDWRFGWPPQVPFAWQAAGLAACCILVRTALEDKTLQAEGDGIAAPGRADQGRESRGAGGADKLRLPAWKGSRVKLKR
jgi:hypothetical protein